MMCNTPAHNKKKNSQEGTVNVSPLVLPETWHDFPYGIKQGVWTESSLVALPQGAKGFPELFHQRPVGHKATLSSF